ncbi:MAG: MATE family efflux transporter [Clostridia bacterium]
MIRDLTEGKTETVLVKFSLPLFISVIFQQMYNMADSMIAGKFSADGESALAAVGASYPITMIFMAIAIGSNIGCSVVISRFFGAKDYRKMKTAVSTVLIASAILAAALSVTGFLTSAPLMRLIRTPEEIFADGKLYLNIYIAGFLFLFLYNTATAVFQSLGDTNTPLYFLIGSSVGNILLDLLFVAGFHLDVAGVAWATFIAQGTACIISLAVLMKRLRKIEKNVSARKFSFPILKEVSVIAVPSILQQSFVSVGNMFIQNLVNDGGKSVIAGYSAAIKLNTFAITCLTTMSNGLSAFASQNIGAGRYDRVRKSFKAGSIMSEIIILPFILVFVFAGSFALRLFMDGNSDLSMHTGIRFLQIVSPFYVVVAVKLVADGILRGAGAIRCFMLSTFSDLAIRVLLSYLFYAIWGATGIWCSWPVGWVLSTCLSLIFYFRRKWIVA